MNNEETILDPQSAAASVSQASGGKVLGKVVYGASGALAGAAATVAGQAIAAPTSTEADDAQTSAEPETDQAEAMPAPEPEETIVATATGIRVAQVDDDASFSQAFADARAQVGPGGIFEWHGRVYATYYKEEWESMTPAERHDFQSSIDYSDVIPDGNANHNHNHNDSSHNGSHHHEDHGHDNSNQHPNGADDNTHQVVDDDVHVLEVGQADLNGDGIPENVAVIEVSGHEILLVDIDQNGTADIALCDVDGDGEPEYRDLTGDNLLMPSQSDGDLYYTQADDTPDYMNDANIDMC